MIHVLNRAFAFFLIIAVGVFANRRHLLPDDAKVVLKKVVINLTLPAAIIINFSRLTDIRAEMILLAILGILINVIMIIAGAIITRNRTNVDRAMFMLCLPSYNIGTFGLPFIQSFLPAQGTITACIFDVGNSIMCTGLNYAFVSEYTAGYRDKNKIQWKSLTGRILTSIPLMTYVIMFLVTILGFKLPEVILTLVEPVADANVFAAMFMTGLLFHLELKKGYMKDAIFIILERFGFSILFALILYYVLPLPLIIRQTLVLAVFCPIAAVSPAYTGMCNGDEGKASCASSISIIMSIVIITILLGQMGLFK